MGQPVSRDSPDSTPTSLDNFFPPPSRFGDGFLLSTNNAGQIHAFNPYSDIDIAHIWTPPPEIRSASPGIHRESKLPQKQYYGICYLPTLNLCCFGGENSFAICRLSPSPEKVHICPIQILQERSNSPATNCTFVPAKESGGGGGGFLATASFDGSFCLYELASIYGSEGPTMLENGGGVATCRARVNAHTDPLYAIRWSPGWPGRLLSGSSDHTAKIWDLTTLEEIGILRGHEGPVYGVELNESTDILVTGSSDRTVRLWDSRTFRQIGCSDSRAQIWSSFWSKENNLFVAGTDIGEVTIWDVRNMSNPVRRWNAHQRLSYIQGMAEIDKETFATASGDHHVKIWTYEGKMKKDYDVLAPSRGVCHVRVVNEDRRQLFVEDSVKDLLENQDPEVQDLLEMCLWELAPGKMRLWAFLKGVAGEPRQHSVLFDAKSEDEKVFLQLLLGDISQIRTPLAMARHIRVLFEIGLTDVASILCTSGLNAIERYARERTYSEGQSALERSQSDTMSWVDDLAQVLLEADEGSTSVSLSLFLASVRDAIAACREPGTEFGVRIDDFLRSQHLLDGISEHDLKQHSDFPGPYTVLAFEQALMKLRQASLKNIEEGSGPSHGVVRVCAGSHSRSCHLDLLVLRTECFSHILNWPGSEVEDLKSTRSVVLESFDGFARDSLKMFTEWIYSDQINLVHEERLRANLPPIFKLLHHSVIYRESRLQCSLVRVLVDLAKLIHPRLLRKSVQTCLDMELFEDKEARLQVQMALSLENWPEEDDCE